jgi:Leucine-rich repeat (LRR) protein
MRAYNLQSALQQPEAVTGLFLNRMELATIPPEVFQLPNLKELDLSYNTVEELPPDIFRLSNLEKLVLSNNRIQRLPLEFEKLTLLREIRLDHNQMTVWPEVLHRLPRLEKIGLNHNRLESIPRETGPFPCLLDLSIAHNKLKELPAGIGRWQALRSLDLSHNQLGKIPADLGQCRELDHLNLGHNRLRQLPPGLENLQKLRFLNLESNAFADLPEVIFSWPHLRRLAAAGNRIRQFSPAIGNLQWLSHLDLGNNQLEALSPAIAPCTQLQTLLLGRNNLPALPPLASLVRLRRLDIRQNQLTTLPSLPAGLKELTASRNHLTALPDAVTEGESSNNCAKLIFIDAKHGENQSFAPSAPLRETHLHEHLPNLLNLDLSYNELTALPGGFDQLKNLEVLDLRKTAVKPWPPTLIQLDRLKELKSDWPAAEHKTFFKLLRACAKAKVPAETRLLFFRWLTQGGGAVQDSSLSTLFQAANLKHSELRRIARNELFRRWGSPVVEFDTGCPLCLLGKTAAPRKKLTDRLQRQNIPVREAPDEETRHMLLGEFPTWFPLLEKIRPVFLTEPQLINWLDEREGRYLRASAGQEEIDRLRALLLHRDPVNVQLAVQIMQGGGVPAPLLTELLVAWKKAKANKLRRQLKELLRQYTPEPARWVLEMPLSLSEKQPEALLRANIRRACEGTPFDEQTILRHARL